MNSMKIYKINESIKKEKIINNYILMNSISLFIHPFSYIIQYICYNYHVINAYNFQNHV